MNFNIFYQKIENYAFEPQPQENDSFPNPFMDLMHDRPIAFLNFIYKELKLAALYNIFFFIFLISIIPYHFSLYLDCSILTTINLLLICFINTIVLPSKYLVLTKARFIKETLGSNTYGPINTRVFNFFYSRILNLNSKISKILMISYLTCFYTFSVHIDKSNPACDSGVGLYNVGVFLTLGFAIKLFITYFRFKNLYFKRYLGYGRISDRELNKMKIMKIKDEKCLKEIKDKEEKCVICWEDYAMNDNMRYMNCDGRHFFHQFCVDQWLTKYSRCPMCNKTFFNDEDE